MVDLGKDRPAPPRSSKKAGLPKVRKQMLPLAQLLQSDRFPEGEKIPNAALIYGIGSAVLFAYSLFFLIVGPRITGIIIWVPAGALLGFALHFLKYNKDE